MALSLEASANVWRKVEKALQNIGASHQGATPAAVGAFKALEAHLTSLGVASLQFVPFEESQADDADGTGLLDAASKVYGFYVKKLASGTDNTVKAFESATVDTTSTEQSLSIPLDLTDQEAFLIYPNGWAQATGLTITQHTTIEGSTDGSDGADGFFVVGAA